MSYQQIVLISNIALFWPSDFGPGPYLAKVNNVSSVSSSLSITLPAATIDALGDIVIFNNIGTNAFTLNYNDGQAVLSTVNSGEVVSIYLNDASSTNGTWSVIPYGGGATAITAFTASSSDASVVISGGNITPPGGVIDLKLPSSISNLTSQITEAGFLVAKSLNPLTWQSVNLVAGENIAISNPNGVASDPVISLSNSLSAVSSMQVGDMTLTGSIIDSNIINGSLSLSTNGTGQVSVNGLSVDVNANVSGINNLSIAGNFTSPFMPSAWGVLTDTLVSGSNELVLSSKAGIASVTGSGGVYTFTFTQAQNNTNYAVFVCPFSTDNSLPLVSSGYAILRTLTYFTIVIVDAGGEKVASVPNGVSVMTMSV